MSNRTKKEELQYKKYRKKLGKDTCDFCEYKNGDKNYEADTKSFKIIKNIFPYSHWDSQGVLDHLMIIPKKHTNTLSDLTSHEAIEFVELISSYENKGYSVYSRAPTSTRKTVFHQHTHLLKLDDKLKNVMVFVSKPRITIVR